ncbi:hypothetical protein SNQ14_002575 [Cronobacter sakazakii]|nr:hypothetical protein [Cronobacter sakazakii]ELY6147105.1 hypothetical protein [Cronobacter sakazakii]
MDKQAIYSSLETLVTQAHQYASSLDIGDERIEAFELYEALRRLQRRGGASEMLEATNPLLAISDSYDDEEDDWWDEDDD